MKRKRNETDFLPQTVRQTRAATAKRSAASKKEWFCVYFDPLSRSKVESFHIAELSKLYLRGPKATAKNYDWIACTAGIIQKNLQCRKVENIKSVFYIDDLNQSGPRNQIIPKYLCQTVEAANEYIRESTKKARRSRRPKNANRARTSEVVGAVQSISKHRRTTGQADGDPEFATYNVDELPEQDENGQVEYDGQKMYRKYLFKAITARNRRLRLNYVLKSFWTEDELLGLALSKRNNSKENYRILTMAEIQKVIDTVKKIDQHNPHRELDSRNINQYGRGWISEIIKGLRHRKRPDVIEAYKERKKKERLHKKRRAKANRSVTPNVNVMTNEVITVLKESELNRTNMGTLEDPKVGLYIDTFAKKHNFDKERMMPILNKHAIHCDDHYFRIICVTEELKMLHQVLELLFSDYQSFLRVNKQQLLVQSNKRGYSEKLIDYIFRVYSVQNRRTKRNPEESYRFKMLRVINAIAYKILYEEKMNETNKANKPSMKFSTIITKCLKLGCLFLSKDSWVTVLKRWAEIDEENDEVRFDEATKPAFAAINEIASKIKKEFG